VTSAPYFGGVCLSSKVRHSSTTVNSQIFFVLRKKTSQVSTLHVVHHGIMPMSGECREPSTKFVLETYFLVLFFSSLETVWFGVKFTPGGHSTFFGLLNTAVHIVMYTYYLFAAMGPQYQKYLWWKKYLTGLQMVSGKSGRNFDKTSRETNTKKSSSRGRKLDRFNSF
jgi:GNS1/SUR4 family